VAQASKNATAMLRELILAGALPAGTKLGEADLATRLDVSRTPVREALSRLAAEGLVDLVPNRGARVARWSDEDLEQIFELRLRLEPYAVGLAIPRLSDSDLDDLDDLAQRMVGLGKPGRSQDLDGIVHLNRQFHRTLINRAANPALASALLAVTHASVVNQNFHNYSPAALARSLAHHVEIVAAARVGNADWANAVMRSHLYNARATMLPAQHVRREHG
jgi:DNA-binding GntR family transcriptional regulator